MIDVLRRLVRDEGGATAIEYGLIAALLGASVYAVGGPAFTALSKMFELLAGSIPALN